jgi:hypothetical protein
MAEEKKFNFNDASKADVYDYFIKKYRAAGYTEKEARQYASRGTNEWSDWKAKKEADPGSTASQVGKQVGVAGGSAVAGGAGYAIGNYLVNGGAAAAPGATGAGAAGASGAGASGAGASGAGAAGASGAGSSSAATGAGIVGEGASAGSSAGAAGSGAGSAGASGTGSLGVLGSAASVLGLGGMGYAMGSQMYDDFAGDWINKGKINKTNSTDAAATAVAPYIMWWLNPALKAFTGKTLGQMLAGGSKTTKQYQYDRRQELFDDQGVKGLAQFDATSNAEAGRVTRDPNFQGYSAYDDASALGNYETFGNDWDKLDLLKKAQVAKALSDAGLYWDNKGDRVIKDENQEAARQIYNDVVSGKLQVDAGTNPYIEDLNWKPPQPTSEGEETTSNDAQNAMLYGGDRESWANGQPWQVNQGANGMVSQSASPNANGAGIFGNPSAGAMSKYGSMLSDPRQANDYANMTSEQKQQLWAAHKAAMAAK